MTTFTALRVPRPGAYLSWAGTAAGTAPCQLPAVAEGGEGYTEQGDSGVWFGIPQPVGWFVSSHTNSKRPGSATAAGTGRGALLPLISALSYQHRHPLSPAQREHDALPIRGDVVAGMAACILHQRLLSLYLGD